MYIKYKTLFLYDYYRNNLRGKVFLRDSFKFIFNLLTKQHRQISQWEDLQCKMEFIKVKGMLFPKSGQNLAYQLRHQWGCPVSYWSARFNICFCFDSSLLVTQALGSGSDSPSYCVPGTQHGGARLSFWLLVLDCSIQEYCRHYFASKAEDSCSLS